MTDVLGRRAARDRSGPLTFRVRAVADRRAIEAALSDDRPFAAYALGHLEPGLAESTRFWIADGPTGRAVVMHGRAMGRTVVTAGSPTAVHAILSLHRGARHAYLSTGAVEHLAALRRAYWVFDTLEMQRMSLTAATFSERPGEVRRLDGRDVHRINRLYATEGGPSHYAAETIDRAIYYGAFDGPRLVAVAGTHIVAPHHALGIVGNVFTDASYRGIGLATRVTSAVTRELLERGCPEVVLTVDPHNTPAVHAYTKLGYRPGTPVIEARLRRRDIMGVGPALRRALGGSRSDEPGVAIVRVRPLAEETT